jgi:hypothetical protein
LDCSAWRELPRLDWLGKGRLTVIHIGRRDPMTAKFTFAALSRPAFLSLLLGSLALSSVGCGASSSAPNLTITSIGQNQCWQQGFTQAWMSRNGNGDVDVVLVDPAAEQVLNGNPVSCPVCQVMHIRVLWSPTKDMKAVVSNASVKWYVIGHPQQQDHLEYSGIAFVSMEEGDNSTTTMKIRNAVLNPSSRHGQLTDPVGASKLEGTFVAREDSARVGKVLNGVKTALSASGEDTHSRMAGAVGTVESK